MSRRSDDEPGHLPGTSWGGFDEFYGSVAPSLRAVAYAMTGRAGLAEELAQEAMMVVLRRWSHLRDYDDPAAFARRVVVNKSVSLLRRSVAEVRALNRVGRNDAAVDIYTDPADERLWEAVRALPARQSQAVVLRYVSDLDTKEIAAVLSCAESTVRVLLHRARTALSTRLQYGEMEVCDDA